MHAAHVRCMALNPKMKLPATRLLRRRRGNGNGERSRHPHKRRSMGGGQSVSALKKAKKKPADAEATRIWTDMDVDNGGTLTVKEIIDALKKNYPDYTASKIKAAVDHFDKDKDGKISRDEVRRLTLLLKAHPSLAHSGDSRRHGNMPVSAVHRSVVCSGDQHRAHQARPEGAEAPVDDQVPSDRSSGGGGGGGGAARRRQHRGVDGGTHVQHAVCMQCTCMQCVCRGAQALLQYMWRPPCKVHAWS